MKLYDTLTSEKKVFTPLDEGSVRMYVCGPTVYDFAHIGNMRSVVVYDVLFRLLRKIYPKVTYVRNITDIDDKIINAVDLENCDVGEFTARYTKFFHEDTEELNCLSPTFEPKATEEVEGMIQIISRLIDSGHAYVKANSVYFNIESCSTYGMLSGRKIDEMISGSRIRIDEDKLHPGDFVLWKPANDVDLRVGTYWQSPWGLGRPGWHIECSAMSYSHFGESFDIHGGGADLMFPHHENELAQSRCAFQNGVFARYWVHNGFLTVNGGEKMSKSLGNFITVRGLKEKGINGQVMRYVFLGTQYRKPLDWNDSVVSSARESLARIYRVCAQFSDEQINGFTEGVHAGVMNALLDDMNTPKALSVVHELVTEINKTRDLDEKLKFARVLHSSLELLGISSRDVLSKESAAEVDIRWIEECIYNRKVARECANFALADKIRNELRDKGVIITDEKDGSTSWNILGIKE